MTAQREQGAVLRVRDLSVEFDTHRGVMRVLDGVSFDIAPGEILGVVGESGAGKSMTGAAVIGLIEPPGRIAGGTVELHGERIDTLRGEDLRRLRGRRIGSVFQDPLTSLNPVYPIGRHLVETIRTHLPVSEKEAFRRALALLADVEIPDPELRIRQYPHQFSGGMRQRVAIALALCAEPQLLIADEPTTALDVSVQAQVIRVFRRVCRERGTAALLITHDMGVIAEAADRVMVMYRGRVRETGPVRAVLDAPREPYTRALMAAIPSVHERIDRLPVPEIGSDSALPVPALARTARAADASAAPLIQVQGLTREFDLSAGWLVRTLVRQPRKLLRAAEDVHFDIARGSTFGLVGESGSGKSTVARMIAGLTKPTAGRVLFDGIDRWGGPNETAALRRRFQMIFQDPYASLNPRWRVDQLIAEPVEVLGLAGSADETEARVADALRRVRMSPDDGRKYPHQFSGGQRQRIAIARALASQPEFIVCDEPTSSLDVSVQAQVLNLMRDLQQEFGLTYLLISHNLAVIRHMCDRIGVMQRGRLVEQGAAEAVLDAPAHAYTRELMAAVPDHRARRT
ncbi:MULTISPECIES: ABC transporter ATP-binding protein [unclassified Variovorax]|uniref:dipeptide ABC transporter ATP-binding protein n=1 Tax=unclassified Variovorax TaxID=663243 RepID=UPI002577DFBC|nr:MULTISPECIES: ABC transporter ATP-binding protein [unclassified Variovorax]MDM0086574.1 ABC transporter ATP-binding protein [Variovorax sp. J22G40]MDM0145170.1 ABC transporter ATP-binding protein [Variovorax sp. J2P1-31]